MGCIFAEMLLGRPVFTGKTTLEVFSNTRPFFPTSFSRGQPWCFSRRYRVLDTRGGTVRVDTVPRWPDTRGTEAARGKVAIYQCGDEAQTQA